MYSGNPLFCTLVNVQNSKESRYQGYTSRSVPLCRTVHYIHTVSTFHLQEASHPHSSASLPLLEVLRRQSSDPHFTPSLAECVATDVASAVATVIEMCCMRELRVATRTNASLLERITVIRRLICSGQLRLPRCIYSVHMYNMYVYMYMYIIEPQKRFRYRSDHVQFTLVKRWVMHAHYMVCTCRTHGYTECVCI